MHKKSLLAVAACVTALAGFSAAPALAGEVQGPPGAANQPGDPTGIRGHANSICAFNGLNDFTQGQEDFQVQNFGVGVAGLTPNEPQDPHEFNPGDPTDGCRGGLLH